ncbi:Rho guanine nucleotide exchange factor 4 [Hypsibius exemplaris]|uniref:Rho guanine nucleotide exchange factor 4 n=1 Tax=Hypsibius exemplaris TaxID=2072580 RepID=A0A1W0WBM0_HYPEX|nr:Rho guanine nucleotide exchange factor 4 [Hypsibius exemplaris]
MTDRFVSTASLSVGSRQHDQTHQDYINNSRRPSPINHRGHPSPSFYRTGAQPIHPVLQRRNTPLRLGPRRATQPVTNFVPAGVRPVDDDPTENLSCDRTGRLPIPPPRGPKNRPAATVTVTRNVSQNGLRSPQLSPKVPRVNRGAAADVSPGARYTNTAALDSWAGLRAKDHSAAGCDSGDSNGVPDHWAGLRGKSLGASKRSQTSEADSDIVSDNRPVFRVNAQTSNDCRQTNAENFPDKRAEFRGKNLPASERLQKSGTDSGIVSDNRPEFHVKTPTPNGHRQKVAARVPDSWAELRRKDLSSNKRSQTSKTDSDMVLDSRPELPVKNQISNDWRQTRPVPVPDNWANDSDNRLLRDTHDSRKESRAQTVADIWAGFRGKDPDIQADHGKGVSARKIGNNGIYGVPRRSKFYIEIPSRREREETPPATPPTSSNSPARSSARMRKVVTTPPINYPPPNHQQRGMGRTVSPATAQQPTFDEIVDEIFKTIGAADEEMDSYAVECSGRRSQTSNGEVLLRNNRIGGVNVLSGSLGDDGDLNHCGGQGFKSTDHHSTQDAYAVNRLHSRTKSYPCNREHSEPPVSRRKPEADPETSRSSAYVSEENNSFSSSPPGVFPSPPPTIQRSQSDVSRFKRRVSTLGVAMPTAHTVAADLCMQGREEATPQQQWREHHEESTTHHSTSSSSALPERNVMQRMRKSLVSLRSGMMARLQKATPRRSSFECDVTEESPVVEREDAAEEDHGVFYDMGAEEGLLKPVNPALMNLERIRKPTSADSGIVDISHEGDDDLSSSSRQNDHHHHRPTARPTSSDYSSDPPPPTTSTPTATSTTIAATAMRRSRSQPPHRHLVSSSFVSANDADDKSSNLDRSGSARTCSRTSSEGSDSSPSPRPVCRTPPSFSSQDAVLAVGQGDGGPANPLYIESLWSQVKYEVDCPQQQIAECSTEGMRANIVREIVKNERDFVANLKDVIEGYLYKCRQRSDMFSKGRIECIFGNVEQLYEFQCEFLADLEASVTANNIHRSEIGHCFLLHQRGFSDLYSDYCNLHTQSAAELQQLKQIKQYAHFFEACRMLQEMVEISLDGFLLQPVQKICKYPLQLAELLKYTPEGHPDCQSVKLALRAMKAVTGMINERKRRLECLEKIALWQETIDNWEGEDLVEQSSQLIHYGDLNKLSSKNSWTHEYTFFLFDHQLIYCRRDILKRNLYAYKGRFDLDEVDIVDLDQNDAGIKHGWVMVCPDKDLSTILLAKSLDEKNKWMEAFRDERKRVKTDLSHGFSIAPKDRLAAIQTAKMLTAGKEKRSKTKDALKDLTDHTQLDQSMRSKSISMTLPVRIRAGQASRNPFANFGNARRP